MLKQSIDIHGNLSSLAEQFCNSVDQGLPNMSIWQQFSEEWSLIQAQWHDLSSDQQLEFKKVAKRIEETLQRGGEWLKTTSLKLETEAMTNRLNQRYRSDSQMLRSLS